MLLWHGMTLLLILDAFLESIGCQKTPASIFVRLLLFAPHNDSCMQMQGLVVPSNLLLFVLIWNFSTLLLEHILLMREIHCQHWKRIWGLG